MTTNPASATIPATQRVRGEAPPPRVAASRRDTTTSAERAAEEEHDAGDEVAARVVGDAGGVLPQREGRGQQQPDPADEEQRRPDDPGPGRPHAAVQSDGERDREHPEDDEVHLLHPPVRPGLQRADRFGDRAVLAARNASWARNAAVNRTGPTMPAQAAPGSRAVAGSRSPRRPVVGRVLRRACDRS